MFNGKIINGSSYVENLHAWLEGWKYASTSIPRRGFLFGIVSLAVIFTLDVVGGTLPSSYDLRTLGYVTPVKNQNPHGTCWSFGSLGALESALKMKEGVVFDLSENHMINIPQGDRAFEYKGSPDRALAYLVSWSGPTLEAIDAYPNPNNSRSRYPIRHVQNVFCINPRTSYLDNDGIKNALVKLGALAVGYYHDDIYYNVSKASYYNNDSALASSHTMDYRDSKWHCVTLVGWDDNYSRNNFSRIPAGNGAFVVKNSWGSEWGDSGYFYVSYYDNSFAWGNYLYSFAGVEETDNYDSIYQYDYLGMTSSFGGSSTTGWGAAMFVAEEGSKISAVGFYALEPNTSYTAYVYTGCSPGKPRSGKLAHSQSGKLEYPGFHTVPFSVESPVNKSQRFSIVLKITTPNNKYPIVYSDPNTTRFDVSVPVAGQTFYSSSGSTWTDFTKSSSSCLSSGQCCFCCKAYTRRTSSAKKLSSIAISGRSTVGGGASAQFSCSATYSDGSTLSVTPTWTITEGAEYASISSGGTVTGKIANDSHAVTAMACYAEGGIAKTAIYKFAITASEYVTIMFDPNGGDMGGVSTSQKVVKGAAVGTLPMPTKQGCSFAGWWIPGTIGGHDSFGMPTIGFPDRQVLASTTFYYDTKVIAYWTFKTYAVTLDQQGGSGGTASVTATYDSPMPTITVPKRTGYTFAGYWTGVDGEGTQYYTASGASAKEWDLASPTTLYAYWILDNALVLDMAVSGPDLIDLYDTTVGHYTAVVKCRDGSSMLVSPKWSIEDVGVNYARMSVQGELYFSSDTYTVYQCATATVTATYGGFTATKQTVLYGPGYVSLDKYRIAQNAVWPGCTFGVTPQTVRWWRHGVFEEPTSDLSDVAFTWSLSCPGDKSRSGDGPSLTVPSDAFSTNGICTVYVDSKPDRERYYQGISRRFSLQFYTSRPQMVTVTFDANGGEASFTTLNCVAGKPYGNGFLPTLSRRGYYGYWYTAREGGTRVSNSDNVPAVNTTLYAHWSQNYYYLKFDANGGEGEMYGQYLYYDTPAAIRARTFKREGYSFEGWALSPDGPVAYQDGEEVLNLRDSYDAITLYAVWRDLGITSPVTGLTVGGPELIDLYDEPGGRYTATVTCSDGTTVEVDPEWSVEGAGVNYARMSVQGELYFSRNTYTVYKCATATVTAAYGGFTNTMQTVLYGPGYVSIDKCSVPQNAVWPGCTFSVTPQTVRWWRHGVLEESTSDLSDVAFTWSLSCPGDKSRSGAGSSFTVPSEAFSTNGMCTVYVDSKPDRERYYQEISRRFSPQFYSSRPQMVTVTFDANGGEASFTTLNCVAGKPYGSGFLPTLSRKGYYGYWYTAREGGSQVAYSDNAPAVSTTLYAQWSPNYYYLTFDANGGDGEMSTQYLYYDSPATIRARTFKREGYSFQGWALSPDGPVAYQDREEVLNLCDGRYEIITLYAVWQKILQFTVSFDANGGAGTMAAQRVTKNVVTNLDKCTFTRTGYSFKEWKGSDGKTYQDRDAVRLSSDLVLAVQWTINQYTVTFNANGGSVSPATRAVANGSAIGTLPTPTRSGYTFDGWWTAASGGSKVLASTKVTADVTYYAQWTANGGGGGSDGGDTPSPTAFTVTFNANGGTGGTTRAVASGTAVGTLPTSTRTGYTFNGWFTAASGGTQITTATKVTANVTYYAHWTKNSTPVPTPDPDPTPVPDDDYGLYYGEIDGSVNAAVASEYNGCLVDDDGNMKGTIQVKVGKPNKKTGLATVKATVQLGTKKVTLKAEGKGGVQIAADGPTAIGLVGVEPCTVVLGSDGVYGFYGNYEIDGARNFFTSKNKGEQGAANAVLGKWLGGVSILADAGNFTVTISAKGKAKVSGTLANGKKATGNAVFLVGEEWACVPVVLPKANISFALWLPLDGGEVVVNGLGDDVVTGRGGALKAGAAFRIDEDEFAAVTGIAALPYLPDGVSVEPKGTKWAVAGGAKAGKVAYRRGTQEVDEAKLGDNPSGLKLTYKAKDGSFKGSFKAYAEVKGKLKATTVSVSGIVLNGVGYGTATVKGKGSVPVTIE